MTLNNYITRNASASGSGLRGVSMNQLMQVNGQSFTPSNPGDLSEVRTVQVESRYRPASQQEVERARVEAAKAQNQAKLDQQYYAALTKHEKANAKSQTAYRRYQGAQAQATYQKTQANAQYGKQLIGLAPQYAKTQFTLGAAGQEAAVKFAEYQALYQGSRR